MNAATHITLISIIMLIIALIIILLGFYLFYNKINNRVGSISLGKLKINNSASGVFFIVFGSLIILFIIYKGTNSQTDTKTVEVIKKYDSNGRIIEETKKETNTTDKASSDSSDVH